MDSDGADSAQAPRSRRAAGFFIAAILAGATVAAVIVVLSADEQPTDVGPFAPQYEGLEERRLAAGVPTMSEGGGAHFHPKLAVYIRGEAVAVPANIGIDPAKPLQLMAGLHTHDTSGTLHNEAGTGATLGDFFAIWGVRLSPKQVGPFKETRENRVRMWVDGKPSDSFGRLVLADGQEIVVGYGEVSTRATG
jgi:hypothetical protein